jgi:hypothetical protein
MSLKQALSETRDLEDFEVERLIYKMRDRVLCGENPMDLLDELELDSEYIFDLLDF